MDQAKGILRMNDFKTIIFDIDGTLSDCEHRKHFIIGKKKDFDSFYNAMGDDTVKENIRALCNMYFLSMWNVIICTGRPESYKKITEDWLKDNRVFYNELKMRSDERQNERDVEIKQDMLNEILTKFEVFVAVDDRNQVVDMWRRNGITCLQVAEGNF